jgi:hypothetical protein
VTLHSLALATLFISAPFLGYAWAELMVRAADRCTCRKGGWNPECPRHGREAT